MGPPYPCLEYYPHLSVSFITISPTPSIEYSIFPPSSISIQSIPHFLCNLFRPFLFNFPFHSWLRNNLPFQTQRRWLLCMLLNAAKVWLFAKVGDKAVVLGSVFVSNSGLTEPKGLQLICFLVMPTIDMVIVTWLWLGLLKSSERSKRWTIRTRSKPTTKYRRSSSISSRRECMIRTQIPWNLSWKWVV